MEAELATRWGETKLEPSVSRIASLMDVLGDPSARTPRSTSRARTARPPRPAWSRPSSAPWSCAPAATPPHVQSITERISLDGAPISAERFIETYEDIKPYVEMVDAQQEFRLSFFEVLTGMAYAAFADAPVDVAVVEVGMGAPGTPRTSSTPPWP